MTDFKIDNYFDYASSTPVDKDVLSEFIKVLETDFANSSSTNFFGQRSKFLLEKSRNDISKILSIKAKDIIFTSSATESNNLFIQGVLRKYYSSIQNSNTGSNVPIPNILISDLEHDSIKKALDFNFGFPLQIKVIKVDTEGFLDLNDFEEKLDENTIAVSIIWAHNEIGVIQNLAEIAKIIENFKFQKLNSYLNLRSPDVSKNSFQISNLIYPLFHIDASQSANYLDLNFERNLDLANVDFMTISGQKIYAPKGIAVLVAKTNQNNFERYLINQFRKIKIHPPLLDKFKYISPVFFGGGQEKNLRSSTENLAGIKAFALALQKVQNSRESESLRLMKLRDQFVEKIIKNPNIKITGFWEKGDFKKRLPNNIHLTINNYNQEILLTKLDLAGFALSAGSGCHSGAIEKSSLYEVIKIPKSSAFLRITLGKFSDSKFLNNLFDTISTIT